MTKPAPKIERIKREPYKGQLTPPQSGLFTVCIPVLTLNDRYIMTISQHGLLSNTQILLLTIHLIPQSQEEASAALS